MKREFLQNLKVGDVPLSKEVIDAILDAHGKDLSAKDSRIEQLNTQLQAAEKSLAQKEFSYLLSGAITAAGGRNEKAISALLDTESLLASENPKEAVETALQNLKQECAYLFRMPPAYASGTGVGEMQTPTAPATLAGALREKFERK